jgi:L-lysine cyclodeaminase
MDAVIEALETALREHARERGELVERDGFSYSDPRPGVLEWMPFRDPGQTVTIKTVGYHPRNVDVGLPTVLATVQRFDQATGRVVALADGVLSTAVRTGAASAIATRILACDGSRTLGLVGAGAQAVTQAHAISRVAQLSDVLVYDTDASAAGSMARRLRLIDAEVSVVSLAELQARSDIISTATSVAPRGGPVLTGDRLRDHVHINAVGSDFSGKTELPYDVLRRSLVCPDFRPQAEREGECQQLSPHEIGPDLPEIAASPEQVAAHRRSWTVFDSTGFALEDHVALSVLVDLASQHGLGTLIAIEHIPADPRNPYEFGELDEPLAEPDPVAMIAGGPGS